MADPISMGIRSVASGGRALTEHRPDHFVLWLETPIGPMRAVADATHLLGLEFHDERPESETPVVPGPSAPLVQIEAELKAYFAGESAEFHTPMRIEGNALERKVWARLMQVPLGETCSYGDIARDTGTIEAVRVVARYCGANPVPVVIPCHPLHWLRRVTDRLRWRAVAQEMAAQARRPDAASGAVRASNLTRALQVRLTEPAGFPRRGR